MIERNPNSGVSKPEQMMPTAKLRKHASRAETAPHGADAIVANGAFEKPPRPLFGGGFDNVPKLFRANVNLRDKQAMIDEIVAQDAKSLTEFGNDVI